MNNRTRDGCIKWSSNFESTPAPFSASLNENSWAGQLFGLQFLKSTHTPKQFQTIVDILLGDFPDRCSSQSKRANEKKRAGSNKENSNERMQMSACGSERPEWCWSEDLHLEKTVKALRLRWCWKSKFEKKRRTQKKGTHTTYEDACHGVMLAACPVHSVWLLFNQIVVFNSCTGNFEFLTKKNAKTKPPLRKHDPASGHTRVQTAMITRHKRQEEKTKIRNTVWLKLNRTGETGTKRSAAADEKEGKERDGKVRPGVGFEGQNTLWSYK